MIRVALLIPVYNNLPGLIKSIKSVEEFEHMEVVVVDDGSSEPIRLEDIEKFSRNCIKIITNKRNSGIIDSLNAGLDYIYQGNFDFILRLDAGDLCINDRVVKQVSYLMDNPDISIVGSYADFVDMDGEFLFTFMPPLGHAEIADRMHVNSCFCHPAVAFRVDAAKQVGFYDNNYPYAEDYEYFWRFLSVGMASNIPESLVSTEANPNGISRVKRKQQLKTRFLIQVKNYNMLRLNSYLGVIKTLVLSFAPVKIIDAVKSYLGKS